MVDRDGGVAAAVWSDPQGRTDLRERSVAELEWFALPDFRERVPSADSVQDRGSNSRAYFFDITSGSRFAPDALATEDTVFPPGDSLRTSVADRSGHRSVAACFPPDWSCEPR